MIESVERANRRLWWPFKLYAILSTPAAQYNAHSISSDTFESRITGLGATIDVVEGLRGQTRILIDCGICFAFASGIIVHLQFLFVCLRIFQIAVKSDKFVPVSLFRRELLFSLV
jgi:hypothetical protein